MRVAVIRFPGSNSEEETVRSAAVAGADSFLIWHRDDSLADADVVIIPGGFAYGDYLRAGAIARFSPIMKRVVEFAETGGPVLGICNGFQVLCEAGLLPGALVRNASLHFISRPVDLRVENNATPFTSGYSRGELVSMQISHGEGRYTASEPEIERLEAENRVVLRYHGVNPNGSVNAIAAVCNDAGNVVGMMPHPERQADPVLGGDGRGQVVFKSFMKSVGAV